MRSHSFVAAEKFILSREFFGMKLGLENIGKFLEDIGSPQKSYKTIHLAGTNGKGSTAALLDAILRENGYKTGLFTSPHLTTLRERVKVDGRMITKKAVTSFIDRNRKELSKRKISFFELITAMGLDYFNRCNVDIAVIETGLGGRLDATNVLQPILTLTTGVSRDHLEILGTSISKIAREKAGIIKPMVPHLSAQLPSSAAKVISDTCKRKSSAYYNLGISDYKIDSEKMSINYHSEGFKLQNVKSSLFGIHQLENMALAIKAASILKESGLKLSKKGIKEGLLKTKWPGRFQIISRKWKPTLVLDVTHNVQGMKAFVESFKIKFGDKRAKVITGFVKRKEHQEMFDLLASIASEINLVPLNNKRSVNLDEMIQEINWRDISLFRYGSLGTAYKKLVKNAGTDDIIIIIGSHYLVGEFIEKLRDYDFQIRKE